MYPVPTGTGNPLEVFFSDFSFVATVVDGRSEMGCCVGKSTEEDMQPAFDPVIGLCDKMKAEGVTVKGLAISGEGSVMGDSPVLQDKAYFEVTLVEPGSWSVGVATRETPLEGLLSQEKSPTAWTLTSSGSVALGPGEVLGVAFDQGDYPVQLYFYKKGRQVHQLSGVRGEVLPVFSVADGAVLEPNFGGKPYAERVPSGYQGIIKSMSLL